MNKFPSPLGVIFSLIIIGLDGNKKEIKTVSVSSRSYILSYNGTTITNAEINQVSVSSRSYILSYMIISTIAIKNRVFK